MHGANSMGKLEGSSKEKAAPYLLRLSLLRHFDIKLCPTFYSSSTLIADTQ